MEVRGHKRILPIAISVFAVYLLTLTKVYYWDGISFAINIEDAGGRFEPNLLFNPNHLVYNVLGWLIYNALNAIGVHARALTLLQLTNCLLSSLVVGLMAFLLCDITRSTYRGVCLALLFAFSATWWRFSTDANSYIASILCTVAAFAAARSEKRGFVVGLLQGLAMLFHELALLAVPVLLYEVWRRKRKRALAEFLATTSFLVGVTYVAAYIGRADNPSMQSFLDWITYASPDAHFTFGLNNLFTSLAGTVKLFLGGRISSLGVGLHAAISVFLATFVIAMGALTWQLRSYGWPKRLKKAPSPEVTAALIWMLPYAVFLLFWLPQNTFYRLFYLPPLLLLFGALSPLFEHPEKSRRLACAVAALVAANLAFYVLPNTYDDANPPLQFARELNSLWDEKTVVYYDSFITDDWTLSYFNPKSQWFQLPQGRIVDVESTMRERAQSGTQIWIETTAYDKLKDASPDWLSRVSGPPRQLLTRDHRVIVTQLIVE